VSFSYTIYSDPLLSYPAKLDNSKTIIRVNSIVVYLLGAQQNGWIVTSIANLIDGYDYLLVPPSQFLPGTTVSVYVYLENYTGRWSETNYNFVILEDYVFDDPYLKRIDLPLRFESDCDIVLTTEKKSVNDDIIMSVFVRRNGIPFLQFGVGIEDFVFDPNDIPTQVWLSDKIGMSVHEGNNSLSAVEESIDFVSDEDYLTVCIPYVDASDAIKGSFTVARLPRVRIDK